MREKERLRALKKKLKKKNKKTKSTHKKTTKTKKKAKKTKKRSVKQYKATLEDLVKSGLLANGEDILYYYPKGTKPFEAKVTFSEETQKCAIVAGNPSGTYKSLSQYALACVHTKTPNRAAVCGWLDVYIKASGKKLFDVRNDFLVKDN